MSGASVSPKQRETPPQPRYPAEAVSRAGTTRRARLGPHATIPAMLFSLLIDACHDIEGLAPATFFEQVTGVSRMTFQRGKAWQVMQGPKRADIERRRDAWMLERARLRGESEEEAREADSRIPRGISAQIVHGLLDGSCSAFTRSLASSFDEADVRTCRMADRDGVQAVAGELGPSSPLGSAYCAPLSVSGLEWAEPNSTPAERALIKLALTRRAHMALSLLAAIDHEMDGRDPAVLGLDAMYGPSRFAALLSVPEPRERVRWSPQDPMARLADLVGVLGSRVHQGRWPDAPPSIIEMGRRAELTGVLEGDCTRFIRSLRSGKRPMTRTAFRQLVRMQLAAGPPASHRETDRYATLLSPYLFAAHVFTRLMPVAPDHPGHRDRTCWRDAYLSWWDRHAEHYRPQAPEVGRQPIGPSRPQSSSRLSQSAGRSSSPRDCQ